MTVQTQTQNESQRLRSLVCGNLIKAEARIRSASLADSGEWEEAKEFALEAIVEAGNMLEAVNTDRAGESLAIYSADAETETEKRDTLTPALELDRWSDLLYQNSYDDWLRATGYLKPCICGEGDYHLFTSEPRTSFQCVRRERLIILEYKT
jgi:hypothetical protein